MTKEKLIKEIKESFSSSKYPGDDNITLPSPYKKQYPDYEGNQIEKFFKGKKWDEISRDILASENSAPGFFTKEAWRYYLPAYMILIIEDIKKADILAEIVVNYLTIPDNEKTNEKVSGFSNAQNKCILHVLEYLNEKHQGRYPFQEPVVAIERYWYQFRK